ncbi:MAG: hypothetical protein CVV41_00240 [Candidatus Riflebacteria bacterium HGW-Riflebacteria-1]|nr:MAG: hypothetical protein CVV41_00240 [Candidatus Riflebacteria bacterium HGW-Riflebacteria-1]
MALGGSINDRFGAGLAIRFVEISGARTTHLFATGGTRDSFIFRNLMAGRTGRPIQKVREAIGADRLLFPGFCTTLTESLCAVGTMDGFILGDHLAVMAKL